MTGTIALTGPAETPGAPQLTAADINTAVNAALNTKAPLSAPVLVAPVDIGTGGATMTGPVLQGTGTANSTQELSIQNLSNGDTASSDLVITADNGDDTTNYVNLGINGSGYSQAAYNVGAAGDGYLYSSSSNLAIGTATAAKIIRFHTAGTTTTQIRATITDTGINSAAIGATTASTGAFTTLSASSTVSGAGFSTYLASPPAIGGSAPAAGSFTAVSATTLSASSTVSGAGFTALLSSYLLTATAASTYATLASPALTGTPSLPTGTTAVTQTAGDNSTKLATTAYVATATAGFGAGGGANTSPGTNQTLTSGSSRALSYAFTAANLTVTLPDATTLNAGGPLFSIYNAGGYTFGILRNGGTLLTAVPPGCSADCYLDDKSTAAGVWHATGQGLQGAYELNANTLSGTVVTSSTTLLGFIGAVAIFAPGLGGSTALQGYDTSTGTVGSVVNLVNAMWGTPPTLMSVDSTHGLLVYISNGGGTVYALVITVSAGATLAQGTVASITTGTPTAVAAVVTLTAGSSYLVAYNVSANSSAVQLGVSGTTATFGSAVSTGAAANWIATRPLSVISSTQVFGVTGTTTSAVRVIGISGTTVTMNTAANATTAPTIALALSTTLFLLCEGSTGLQAVSVSGTTCTVGTQSTSFGSNTFTGGQFAASSTSFILGNSADAGVLYYGTISGTTITAAASLLVQDIWGVGGTSAAITLLNTPVVAVSTGYLYVPSQGVLTASGSAFSNAQIDLWPDQMVISGSVALQDGSGGTLIPLAAGDGFKSLATAQTSGNLLVKPGRIYPVGLYIATLSGAISTGKFLIGTASPGRVAPTSAGAQWRVGVWQLAT